MLLRHIPQPEFGSFAFLLGFAAFSWAVGQAAFCAPLPQVVQTAGYRRQPTVERAAGSANLTIALAGFPLFLAIALVVGLDLVSAALFAAFAVVSLVRWFGRSLAYLHGEPTRSVASDWLYCGFLLASVVVIVATGEVSLAYAYLGMTIAALVGLTPFGIKLIRISTAAIGKKPVTRWIKLTRSKSSWSLVAVLANELTANAHAYVVLIFAGAASFAPIAATALLVRPIAFASVAVQDADRPRLARNIQQGALRQAQQSIKWARALLALTWFSTCGAVAALLFINPNMLFPSAYDWNLLLIGSALWLLVSGLSIIRIPDTTFLQAAGRFREIAGATMESAAVSISTVLVLVLIAGPIWSIAGIFAGRIVTTYRIGVMYRQWRDSTEKESNAVRNSPYNTTLDLDDH